MLVLFVLEKKVIRKIKKAKKKRNKMDFFLFAAMSSDGSTRGMLIPLEHFKLARSSDYNLLISSAKDMFLGRELITNVLIRDVLWNRNSYGHRSVGMDRKTDYSEIVEKLTDYAEDCKYETCEDGDFFWLSNSYKLASSVSSTSSKPLETYNAWKNRKEFEGHPVNIVNSFFVLRTHDGEIPDFPTEEERRLLALSYERKAMRGYTDFYRQAISY